MARAAVPQLFEIETGGDTRIRPQPARCVPLPRFGAGASVEDLERAIGLHHELQLTVRKFYKMDRSASARWCSIVAEHLHSGGDRHLDEGAPRQHVAPLHPMTRQSLFVSGGPGGLPDVDGAIARYFAPLSQHAASWRAARRRGRIDPVALPLPGIRRQHDHTPGRIDLRPSHGVAVRVQRRQAFQDGGATSQGAAFAANGNAALAFFPEHIFDSRHQNRMGPHLDEAAASFPDHGSHCVAEPHGLSEVVDPVPAPSSSPVTETARTVEYIGMRLRRG